MAGKIYFGNTNKQSWIVAPASGLKNSNPGWSSETELLNGSSVVRRSVANRKRFDMSWVGSMNDESLEDSLYTIKNFHDGIYGTGSFYWLDPFAMTSNLLPQGWAAPGLANSGWKAIVGQNDTVTKAYPVDVAVANDYPITSASFTTSGAFTSSRSQTIIIPDGYTFHFGWHGPDTSANTGIRIVPYKRSDGTAGAAIDPTRLSTSNETRTNVTVDGSTYSYVKIYLYTGSASTVIITGMIAQVREEGKDVPDGNFISGRGTRSLQFASTPDIDYYSSNVNNGQIGLAITLVEE